MPANIDPIYCKAPDIQWVSLINASANTATDGTGTVFAVWTADAINGGFLKSIRVKALSVTGSNNVANVLRFFLNNGSTNATPANNSFFGELALPATTGVNNAALPDLVFPVNEVIPLGYKINACVGTATGAALGWYLTGFGGKF